eukprot:TRINITY_DN27225_c0_g1_i1.p1 TRINITY_DN27225_c0_g1~~TRINITY_DN27225_c0_g1_i1.p1  ORF type:complete len:222 (+),score=49.80 TRINITY_DN27225_c0_g1_i1:92-757(+)
MRPAVEYTYHDNGYWRCGDGGGRWWQYHGEDWHGGPNRGGRWRRWRGFGVDMEDDEWQAWRRCGGEDWERQEEVDALRKEVNELKMKVSGQQEVECQWRWWAERRPLNTEARANVAEKPDKSKREDEQAEYAKECCYKSEAKLHNICSEIRASVQSNGEANSVMMKNAEEHAGTGDEPGAEGEVQEQWRTGQVCEGEMQQDRGLAELVKTAHTWHGTSVTL